MLGEHAGPNDFGSEKTRGESSIKKDGGRERGRESLSGMGHKQRSCDKEREREGAQGRGGRKALSRWAGDGRKIASREHAHVTSGLGGEEGS